jgi:hypothetical protein
MAAAGLNGICRTASDWQSALEAMMRSENRRREHGLRGNSYATTAYSDGAIFAHWDDVFRSLNILV